MEKESKFEFNEKPEQKLARLLKEKGEENPEARDLLDRWTREQEKQVEQSDNYPLAQIYFNLRRARLYFEAGYVNDAFENFEAARTQAWNYKNNELYQTIMKEMDELEDFIGKQK